MDDFEGLRPWATPVECRYIDAVIEHGGIRPAAVALGKHRTSLQGAFANLRRRAAAKGFAPRFQMNTPVPDPFLVKGQSQLRRVDPVTGERSLVLEWTKTKLDDEQWLQNVKEGVAAFIEQQDPIEPPVIVPNKVDADIIPWIQIGDAHLGMLAHEAETGSNFDLKIAYRELLTAVLMLIEDAEPTERLVINDLGDFTHYENMAGVTEASGHALDYDGRFPKMVKVYSQLMRAIVDAALTKAKFVDVIVNQGNHSRTNDIWMAELLRVAYGNTGRVNVLNNDSLFVGYRMGRTFVLTHHSDKCKPKDLAHVMATDFARDWGESDYRYIDIGHIHHNMVLKEHPGVVVESFNILAPRDNWAHSHGYRSRQSITRIDRSRQFGEVGRRLLPIRQVQERIRVEANGASHYVAKEQRAFTV